MSSAHETRAMAASKTQRTEMNTSARNVFRHQFYKTEMCRYFRTGCAKGMHCPFAHGENEMRNAPDLVKTSLCEKWVNRKCPLTSEQCPFAHGWSEMRATPAFVDYGARQSAASKRKGRRSTEGPAAEAAPAGEAPPAPPAPPTPFGAEDVEAFPPLQPNGSRQAQPGTVSSGATGPAAPAVPVAPAVPAVPVPAAPAGPAGPVVVRPRAQGAHRGGMEGMGVVAGPARAPQEQAHSQPAHNVEVALAIMLPAVGPQLGQVLMLQPAMGMQQLQQQVPPPAGHAAMGPAGLGDALAGIAQAMGLPAPAIGEAPQGFVQQAPFGGPEGEELARMLQQAAPDFYED